MTTKTTVKTMIWAVFMITALILASCTKTEPKAKNSPSPRASLGEHSLDEEEISRLEASHLNVKVKGAVEFSYDADTDVRIVALNYPERADTSLLSVGIHDMKTLKDGAQFRIAFDLAGIYKGPGKYKLPAAKSATPKINPSLDPEDPNPNKAVSSLSSLQLLYIKLKPGQTQVGPETYEALYQFQRALVDCTIQVSAGEHSGKITCPKVADEQTGATVSVQMTWGKA